jgi:MATE family multidrug resistance protein
MSAQTFAELRSLLLLAWPVVLAQLGMMGLGLVDTWMVGRAFPESLAGLALGNTWQFASLIIGLGVANGLDPLLAQAWGARDDAGYDRAFVRGVAGVVWVSIPIMALQVVAGPALRWLGEPPEAIGVAAAWTAVILYSVPAFLLYALLRQAMQCRGRSGPALWVVLIGNVVNAAANPLMMHGYGSFEGFGPVGTAYSTLIVRWVMFAALLGFADREREALRRAWRGLFDVAGVLRVLRRVLPVGIQFGTEVWAFQAGFMVTGWYGAHATSGHAIAGMLCGASFMVPIGLGAAASARVGNHIGAGFAWQPVARLAVQVGLGWGLMAAAAFVLVPALFVDAFVGDAPEIRAIAISLMPYAAAFQVFDAAQGVMFGVLRGAGDTEVPTVANLVGYWVVGLPVGVLLAVQGWEVYGIWVGYTLGLALVTALLLGRLAQMMRRPVARATT